MKLPTSFYQTDDVFAISQALLGKWLVSSTIVAGEPVLTAGMIVETEAYAGTLDKASHAFGGRRTQRTETMFQAGGVAYVYLCYGIHHLFNVVTGPKDVPHAVLIRGIEPVLGIPHMLARRRVLSLSPKVAAGPALLTQALAITVLQDGLDLTGEQIWLADSGKSIHPSQIAASPRIGVAYAQEYASCPWRFYLRHNPYVSAQRKS